MSEKAEERARLRGENAALRERIAELELESRRAKATLYSIGDAIIATDAAGVIVQMNPVAETLTGWNEAEAKGRSAAEVFRIVAENALSEVECPVARVLREGIAVRLANDIVLVAKDGTERPIVDSGAPIRSESGELTGVILVFSDQTAERAAQRKVEERAERFRTVFESSPLGKSLITIDGRLSINRAFCELLGYSEEELRAQSWQELTHPDDVEGSARIEKSLLDGEAAHAQYEKRYVHKNGEAIWTHVTTALARDAEGSPLFFITTVADITERRGAETALRHEKERIRTILDLVGDPIFVKDDDHRITLANRAFYEMFSLDEESVLGRTLIEAVPEGERHHFLKVDRDVLDSGVPDLREETLTVNEKPRTIITRKSRFIDGAGKKFLVGSIHDITERKRAEDALKEYHTELERRVEERTLELTAANRELEAFAYSVSHDLRAPLRGIDGFSKALLDDYQDELDATARGYLNRVRAGTQRMGRLIDDLLNLSRLSRAEMSIQRLDLGELGKKIAAELKREEPHRSIDFEFSPDLTARGDPALLEAALENLLRNACKFTGQREHARILLGVAERGGERDYFVRDNGAGFDMAYVEKLFGAFQRLHDTSEFPGDGIGLAIVQRIILRHGGRVWAEGKVDVGATFYFTLPHKSGTVSEGVES